MRWIELVGEWATAPLLALSSVFTYAHEQYLWAAIIAACAGFVTGIRFAKLAFDRGQERQVRRALDELFDSVR